MNKVLEEIKKIGIVPVVVLDDAKDAEPLAKALCEGGLPCAEVTFRTEAAEESIRIISEKYPEMLVGAGTVLTTEQVDRAVAAGAKFIVSPGFNPKIVKYCIDRDIPVTPGTQTPSEMEQAIEMGLDVVKFFPAEPAGGLKMIKAVAAPYTMLQFMPTGGINLNNVEGQMAGGVHMGLGFALMEDTIIDPKSGEVLNSNFANFKMLTFEDMPEITKVIADTYEPTGPLGAKAIGEGVTNPVAAAVGNAIYNACGVRIRDLPCSPEKILRKLKEKEEGKNV